MIVMIFLSFKSFRHDDTGLKGFLQFHPLDVILMIPFFFLTCFLLLSNILKYVPCQIKIIDNIIISMMPWKAETN